MYNHKLSIVFSCLLTLSGLAHSQTVDELSNPQPIQSGAPSSQTSATTPVTATRTGAITITGMYISKDFSRAEVSVGGQVTYLGVGDVVRDSWIVDGIDAHGVQLKRCAKGAKCTTRKITYTGSL